MHSWNLSESDAVALQKQYAEKVRLASLTGTINSIAGVDVAYAKSDENMVGAVVLLNATTLSTQKVLVHRQKVNFPYIPGLFSFRELPVIVEVFKQLKEMPDLIVCDGHGVAHPRRFGLACHLGVLLNIPTIGCAKTALLPCDDKVGDTRGSSNPIKLNNETVGCVLRTQDNVKPVFVSPGHRITINESKKWIMALSRDYRLPETTRAADHAVKMAMKKDYNEDNQ